MLFELMKLLQRHATRFDSQPSRQEIWSMVFVTTEVKMIFQTAVEASRPSFNHCSCPLAPKRIAVEHTFVSIIRIVLRISLTAAIKHE